MISKKLSTLMTHSFSWQQIALMYCFYFFISASEVICQINIPKDHLWAKCWVNEDKKDTHHNFQEAKNIICPSFVYLFITLALVFWYQGSFYIPCWPTTHKSSFLSSSSAGITNTNYHPCWEWHFPNKVNHHR